MNPSSAGISDQSPESSLADPFGNETALGRRSDVVPEDGGPHHTGGFVEQHRTVHLPRKADGPDSPHVCRARRRLYGFDRALPPIARILFRPPRRGDRNFEWRFRLTRHLAVFIDHQRLDRGCANVYSKVMVRHLDLPGVETTRAASRGQESGPSRVDTLRLPYIFGGVARLA